MNTRHGFGEDNARGSEIVLKTRARVTNIFKPPRHHSAPWSQHNGLQYRFEIYVVRIIALISINLLLRGRDALETVVPAQRPAQGHTNYIGTLERCHIHIRCHTPCNAVIHLVTFMHTV